MVWAMIVILTLLVVPGMAQEKVDLSTLIDRILTENYQVKIVRNEAAQAANSNTLGNAGFLPVVDVYGTNTRARNNTKQELFTGETREGENAETKVLSGYIEANWTVFDGFRMFATRDKLALLQQAGETNARYYIEQTIADVSVAYYQLVQEVNLLDNLQKTFKVSRFRYRLEAKKRQVGAGTTLDYNLARMDYLTDSLQIVAQQQVIRSLQIQLNRLTRRDPESVWLPAVPELTPAAVPDKQSLTDKAINANKDIRLSQLQELIAEKNVRIQKAGRYPEIDLSGRYSYSRQTNEIGVTQENRTYGYTVGITVRMNLFDGGKLNTAIRNELLAKENTTLARQQATDLITSEVVDRYYEYQSLLKQREIALENIRLAEQSQEIASVRFEQGTINGYDFRQTQLSVITAQNRLIAINFSLKALEVDLDRLTGNLESLL